MVDTGETNHMIRDKDILKNDTLVESTKIVQLPTEESTHITHVGSTQMSKGDYISNILCAPNFKFNPLSVSQLTKELNYCAFFYYNFFILLVLCTEKVKEVRKVLDGLYIINTRQ